MHLWTWHTFITVLSKAVQTFTLEEGNYLLQCTAVATFLEVWRQPTASMYIMRRHPIRDTRMVKRGSELYHRPHAPDLKKMCPDNDFSEILRSKLKILPHLEG